MKAGRKRKPAALKIIQGNRGKRPILADLEIPGQLPPPPEGMEPEAVVEWTRVVGLMPPGVFSPGDLGVLASYRQSYARWIAAERAITAKTPKGVITNRGADGAVRSATLSPFVVLSVKYQTAMLRAASELGLTPSSRTRLGGLNATKPKGHDLDDALFG